MVASVALAGPTTDRPVIGLRNTLGDVVAPGTRWTQSGVHTDPDESDPDRPADWAHDDRQDFLTRPDPGTAAALWHLSFAVGGIRGGNALVVGSHNLGTIGGVTVDVDVANAANFAGYTTIFTWTPTSDARLAALLFLDWSDVDYLRLRLTRGAGNFTPQIGEVYFGARYQLSQFPNLPWDDRPRGWSGSMMRTKSNALLKYTTASGFSNPIVATSVPSSAERDALRGWWDGADGGSRPSWWWFEPMTHPERPQLMATPAEELRLNLAGPIERLFTMPLTEEPPFLSEEP